MVKVGIDNLYLLLLSSTFFVLWINHGRIITVMCPVIGRNGKIKILHQTFAIIYIYICYCKYSRLRSDDKINLTLAFFTDNFCAVVLDQYHFCRVYRYHVLFLITFIADYSRGYEKDWRWTEWLWVYSTRASSGAEEISGTSHKNRWIKLYPERYVGGKCQCLSIPWYSCAIFPMISRVGHWSMSLSFLWFCYIYHKIKNYRRCC